MKFRNFAFAAGVLALGLAAWITPIKAQGPLWDVVHVNLPYSVTIGDKTLQPGEYVIQQNRDPGGASRVLLIYSDNGMHFETSALTIPVLDINTARDTKVVLHHIGPDYYFDKVWIQGKDYGYEFPLPNSVKAREREQMAAVSVPATYSTMQSQQTQTNTETANNNAAATQETTPPPTTAETAPPPPPPVTEQNTQTEQNTANREETPAPAPQTMPATSAGWLMMLLGGTSLSGIGVALRRKR